MGVYIFKSKHGPYIKVGHYQGRNAWSRVAHRGFYSCVCPEEIRDRVSVNDLELVAWFPELTKKEERMIKTKWRKHRIYEKSEWFLEDLFIDIYPCLLNLDTDCMHECDRDQALRSKRRL